MSDASFSELKTFRVLIATPQTDPEAGAIALTPSIASLEDSLKAVATFLTTPLSTRAVSEASASAPEDGQARAETCRAERRGGR